MEIATRPITLSDEEFNELANNPDRCKEIVAENKAMHTKLSNIIMEELSQIWNVPFKKIK